MQLEIVVSAPRQVSQLLVREVLDQLAKPRVRPEEVLSDVAAILDRISLELAVDDGVHLVQKHAVHVALEEFIPL